MKSNVKTILLWLLFVLIAALVVLGVWWNWKWLADAANASDSNAALIRNVVLTVVALVSLPYALWRGIIAQRQADIAQHQADMTQWTLLDERYRKGLEMLGSDDVTTRRHGVDRLAILANDSPHHFHIRVMLVLSDYVRRTSQDSSQDLRDADSETDTTSTSNCSPDLGNRIMDSLIAQQSARTRRRRNGSASVALTP